MRRVVSLIGIGGPGFTPAVAEDSQGVVLPRGAPFDVPESALGYLEVLALFTQVVMLNTVYFVPEGGIEALPFPPPTGFQVRVLEKERFDTLWRAICSLLQPAPEPEEESP